MIAICLAGADEAQVIANHGSWQRQDLPRSTEIHHRNKTRGERKLDERFWMAASRYYHDQVEHELAKARQDGFVLPFEADQDGRLPDGTVCPTTPELMARFAQK